MRDYQLVMDRLDSVRRRFLSTLPPRIDRLSELRADLDDPRMQAHSLRLACFEVHKIAGTAGTLGYVDLGRLAAQIEAKVALHMRTAPELPPEPDLVVQFDEFLEEGRRVSGE
jgi:HPt (histidine-containing phosphotransfer) domain-containing protein